MIYITASNKIKVLPAKPSNKSVFIKKSLFTTSGNGFKFDFPDPVSDVTEEIKNVELEEDKSKNSFHFVPSGNTFKFNFTNTEENTK